MLHAKFQDQRLYGSREEDFKGFYLIWVWRPSWSCDLDHLYKNSSTLPKENPHEIWLRLAKQFQRKICLKIMVMYIRIAPGQGQTAPTPLGSKSFQKHKSSVNLVIFCKSYPLNDFVTFSHSNAYASNSDISVK